MPENLFCLSQQLHLSLLTAQLPHANLVEQLCTRFQHLQEVIRAADDQWAELRTLLTDKLRSLTAFCDANFAFARDLERLQLPQLSSIVSIGIQELISNFQPPLTCAVSRQEVIYFSFQHYKDRDL